MSLGCGNMRTSKVSLNQIIELGKKEGIINQGLIALWTGKAGMSAYLIFKQIKQLCEKGYLDDDSLKCVSYGDEVVFKSTVKVREKELSESDILGAKPIEDDAQSKVAWGNEA